MKKQYAALPSMPVMALIALCISSALASLCGQTIQFELPQFPEFSTPNIVECDVDDAVNIADAFEIDIEESSIHLKFLITDQLNA